MVNFHFVFRFPSFSKPQFPFDHFYLSYKYILRINNLAVKHSIQYKVIPQLLCNTLPKCEDRSMVPPVVSVIFSSPII